MTTYSIYNEDVVKWCNEYRGPLMHACLCDPPYHLTSITKRFGKNGLNDPKPAKFGKDGAFSRASKGFMNQTWDGGDVAFDPNTWRAIGAVMYPGAFGMAFASSRGWHRLAVAIEDADFIISNTIWCWVHIQGFPKAHTVPDDRFNGYAYSPQALKPAVEPIIVFQKPYANKAVVDITTTGAGTLNIKDTAILSDKPYTINTWDDAAHPWGNGAGNEFSGKQSTARYPSNFVLYDETQPKLSEISHCFNIVNTQINAADPVYYASKPSKTEKSAGLVDKNPHPTIKPIALAKYLATMLLPPVAYAPRHLFVPFSGVSSEMIGAMQAGWECIDGVELGKEYCEIGAKRMEYWYNKQVSNNGE